MKKSIIYLSLFLTILISCSKDDNNSSSNNNNNTNPNGCDYFPYVVGSKYVFKKTDGSNVSYDTIIPIMDTMIHGTKFLKCIEKGTPIFLCCNYNGYFTQISDLSFFGMTCTLEGQNIKIGGSKGDMWSDSSYTSSGSNLSFQRDLEIKDVNITTSANGVSYNDVIKIEAQNYTYISSFVMGVNITNYYYSKQFGLIKAERYDNASTTMSQLREFYIKL